MVEKKIFLTHVFAFALASEKTDAGAVVVTDHMALAYEGRYLCHSFRKALSGKVRMISYCAIKKNLCF